MKKNDYRPRVIDRHVEEYLSAFGAICIEGPKWCGKTWTSSHHSKSEILIGDPAGNFQNRKLAELQPSLVLEGETPRLIDEWQEVPPLWDAVRHLVDERAAKGQFILTGSIRATTDLSTWAGTGRVVRLAMHPLSEREIVGETGLGSSDEALEDQQVPAMPAAKFVSKGLTRGLGPQMVVVRGNTALAADAFADTAVTSYTETLTQSEVRGETTLLSTVETTTVIGKPAAQAVTGATLTVAERRAEARVRGYEGEDCRECGNFTLVRNGTCLKCDTCGSTSGCS